MHMLQNMSSCKLVKFGHFPKKISSTCTGTSNSLQNSYFRIISLNDDNL